MVTIRSPAFDKNNEQWRAQLSPVHLRNAAPPSSPQLLGAFANFRKLFRI